MSKYSVFMLLLTFTNVLCGPQYYPYNSNIGEHIFENKLKYTLLGGEKSFNEISYKMKKDHDKANIKASSKPGYEGFEVCSNDVLVTSTNGLAEVKNDFAVCTEEVKSDFVDANPTHSYLLGHHLKSLSLCYKSYKIQANHIKKTFENQLKSCFNKV